MPLHSDFGMPNAHSADVLVEMKSFNFSSLHLGKLSSVLVLDFCLPPMFLITVTQTAVTKLSAVRKGTKILSDVVFKFQSCFQIYFLSCFLADIPLKALSRFRHQT